MSRLVIVNCPRCWQADEVTAARAVDGAGFLYTCQLTSRHPDRLPHVWQQDPALPEDSWSSGDGILDDLYDPLLAVFVPGEPYIEYGIIEERLRATAHAVFAGHVHDAGHVALGAIRNTASNRIGMALGLLGARGKIVCRRAPATGGWSYNREVGFWALPPAEVGRPMLTWADYCTQIGRDPELTDIDRVGLTSPRQGITVPWQCSHPRPWER